MFPPAVVANAGLTIFPDKAVTAAIPPTARPELLKKVLLSTIFEAALPMKDDVREPIATPFVFFLNIIYSPFKFCCN